MSQSKKRRGLLGFLQEYVRALQRYIMTGLLVWIPLIVTIWITWWMIATLGSSMNSGIEWTVNYIKNFSAHMPLLGFVANFEYEPWIGFLLAILLFLSTGLLTRYLVAQKVISAAEHVLAKIPLVSKIYGSSQQIRDVFMNRDGGIVQEVVLIEFPHPGMYSIGLVTSKEQGIIQNAVGRHMQAVFLPTTPNPTSGYLLYVRSEEIIPLDVTVEDAMKMVISGGAYLPERASLVKAKALALEEAGQRDLR
jgi:uncharacterized membrane protein